ncbi:serine/threonine-protein kinase, partial [Actinomadura fulvescens]
LQQAGPRANAAALQRLAVATATALAAIHQAGIVHRDFKPSNVLLGPDGPRVIDFGIARASEAPLTMTSSIIGTPAYMAPEQFEGKTVGAPADVFAWGVVMVFAATGEPAFGADTLPAVMKRVLSDTPDLSGLPEPLRTTVGACLAKDPAQRPSMQDVLLRLLGSAQQTAAPADADATVVDRPRTPAPQGQHFQQPGPGQQPQRQQRQRPRRRPALVLGAGIGGGLLAAAAAVVLVVTQLTGGSGSKDPESTDAAGVSGNNPQQNGGAPNSATGAGKTGNGSGKASPGAGNDPKAGGGRTNPSQSPGAGGGGSNPGGGSDGGGNPDGGSGGGGDGGDGGGGGGGSQPPPTASARIAYFKVGKSGCNPKGYPMDFKYSIATDKNPTKVEYALYFDGRLGVGHPIRTTADPNWTISNSQTEDTAGTHTYRMVLLSPVRAERTVTVKVC